MSADGDGYSLVFMCPGLNDPADPQSWRTSAVAGGNPGGSDAIDLAAWAATHGVTDLSGDDDEDGLAALLEYASGQDPNQFERSGPVDVEAVESDGMLYPVLVFRQLIGADEISLATQGSADLLDWAAGPTYFGRTNNGDGTSSVWFRSNDPVAAGEGRFLRMTGEMK